MILMSAHEGTKQVTHNEAGIILKKYVRRKIPYQTLNTVRCNYLALLYGEQARRVQMFPAFLERLKHQGHHVEHGTVDADTMREYTILSAENIHNFRFKNVKDAPKFKKESVDLSGIIDGRRYISWWSFASNVAVKQSLILKEVNGEADFCTSSTPYGGAFGVEVTHDADRHICIRMILWSYRHECAETYKRFFIQ